MMLNCFKEESDKESYKKDIALYEALYRLNSNPDFSLIVRHYTESHALELMQALSKHDKDSSEFNLLQQKILAVGEFNTYLTGLIEQGQWAKDCLKALENNPDDEAYYE